jgi:hypothetical protein
MAQGLKWHEQRKRSPDRCGSTQPFPEPGFNRPRASGDNGEKFFHVILLSNESDPQDSRQAGREHEPVDPVRSAGPRALNPIEHLAVLPWLAVRRDRVLAARPSRMLAFRICRSFPSAPDHDRDIPSAVADDGALENWRPLFALPGANGLFELVHPTALQAIDDVTRELDVFHGAAPC